VSEDAAGNVAGMQDGRQAEGRQAPQADATAFETMRAGQSQELLTALLCRRCTVAVFPSQF